MNLSAVYASLVVVLLGTGPAHAAPTLRAHAPQADSAYMPARGSAERAAILDAMRAHRRRFDPQRVIFVVSYLRVQRGWAWASVRPQSPDGRSHYEDESALLRRRAGRWEVVETMPAAGEREGTPTEEDCAWFQQLRWRLPALPTAVLPAEGRRPCPARR